MIDNGIFKISFLSTFRSNSTNISCTIAWITFPFFRKWLKFAAYYFIVVSSSVFYVTASTVWSVPDKIDKDNVYDVALLLLGVSDYQWHEKYTPNGRNQYCNLNKNGGRLDHIIQQIL